MKHFSIFLLFFAVVISGCDRDNHHDAMMEDDTTHRHDTDNQNQHQPEKIDRIIEVSTHDDMTFSPSEIEVKPHETIRFVVTNKGMLPHEFSIGSQEEQIAHGEMMRNMPDMEHHHDKQTLSLAVGDSKDIIWQFGEATDIEIACHVPGHYEAGMKMKVRMLTANHKH